MKNNGLIVLAIILVSELGYTSICSNSIAKSSVYFIPKMSDYCSGSSPCPKFRKQVRMQGSGIMPGNKLLTYNGKKVDMGDCRTAIGASGACLVPFISVAADPRYYRMGDIIQMPSLKGKRIELPNGRFLIHPGYFIVQDTGGAIKGKNRFDFFTGTYQPTSRANAFGYHGTTSMTEINDCDTEKSFTVVRRQSGNYQNSLLAIEESLRTTGHDRKVASVAKSSGEAR